MHPFQRPSRTLVIGLPFVVLGCSQTPKDPGLTPIEGNFARYPNPERTIDEEHDGTPNPWLLGFGGVPNANEAHGLEVEPGSPTDPPSTSGGGMTGQLSEPPQVDTSSGGTNSPEHQEPATPVLPDRRLERYLEGEGTDKLLEMSGTPGPTESTCRIEIFSNGATTPWRSIELPADFPSSGHLEICSKPELHPSCTETMSGSLFNGNDALVLVCNESILDSFGRVGEDPGVAWVSPDGAVRSEGQDLVRCGSNNRTDPFAPFFIAEDWIPRKIDESPEEVDVRCDLLEAFGSGGAGGAPHLF